MTLFAGMLSFRENYYNQTVWLAELVTLEKSLGQYEKMPTDDWEFSMDVPLVVLLSLVAWRCRNRALGQEAIKLLLASPRGERLWDGIFTVLEKLRSGWLRLRTRVRLRRTPM